MAIYHLSVKTVSRSAGRSATAAAAYRTATRVYCEREGRTHDYARRRGVDYAEIIVPPTAVWVNDREQLWNAAERAEKRGNATVAREYELALPAELSAGGRVALAREFALAVSERYGVAADIAIHGPHRRGDTRNFHAHVLTTTRVATGEGLTEKTRVLDDRKSGPLEVTKLRGEWAEMTNRALARERIETRVDHRSLTAQHAEAKVRAREAQARGDHEAAREARLAAIALDRPAEKHVGVTAMAIERRARLVGREVAVTDRGAARDLARAMREQRMALVNVLRERAGVVRERARGAIESTRARVRQLTEFASRFRIRMEDPPSRGPESHFRDRSETPPNQANSRFRDRAEPEMRQQAEISARREAARRAELERAKAEANAARAAERHAARERLMPPLDGREREEARVFDEARERVRDATAGNGDVGASRDNSHGEEALLRWRERAQREAHERERRANLPPEERRRLYEQDVERVRAERAERRDARNRDDERDR